MKVAAVLIIISAVLLPGQASQALSIVGKTAAIQSTTGTISAVKKHRIILIEDNAHLKRSFLYMRHDIGQLNPGDHVRVYFRDPNTEALSIQKLTALKYHKETQNLGYITGTPQENE